MVVDAVRVQTDHQVKVPLVRIRLSLLAHVVARGLAEMQPAHRHLGHLLFAQIQSAKPTTIEAKSTRRVSFGKEKYSELCQISSHKKIRLFKYELKTFSQINIVIITYDYAHIHIKGRPYLRGFNGVQTPLEISLTYHTILIVLDYKLFSKFTLN